MKRSTKKLMTYAAIAGAGYLAYSKIIEPAMAANAAPAASSDTGMGSYGNYNYGGVNGGNPWWRHGRHRLNDANSQRQGRYNYGGGSQWWGGQDGGPGGSDNMNQIEYGGGGYNAPYNPYQDYYSNYAAYSGDALEYEQPGSLAYEDTMIDAAYD